MKNGAKQFQGIVEFSNEEQSKSKKNTDQGRAGGGGRLPKK